LLGWYLCPPQHLCKCLPRKYARLLGQLLKQSVPQVAKMTLEIKDRKRIRERACSSVDQPGWNEQADLYGFAVSEFNCAFWQYQKGVIAREGLKHKCFNVK
jgi:hypothetical protein